MKGYRIPGIIMTVMLGIFLLLGISTLSASQSPLLYFEILAKGRLGVIPSNLVTAIYLDFRIFDTLLEALLLMVAVMGVSQFSRLSVSEQSAKWVRNDIAERHNPSNLMSRSLALVYPIIAILGVYVIMTGTHSPGGGFQGGALLSAIVISIHFTTDKQVLSTYTAEMIEKCAYIFIVSTVTLFLLVQNQLYGYKYDLYFLIMNVLIGIKVFSGFTVIYYEFISSIQEGKVL